MEEHIRLLQRTAYYPGWCYCIDVLHDEINAWLYRVDDSIKKFENQKGIWSNYVEKELIPRINGFEIAGNSPTTTSTLSFSLASMMAWLCDIYFQLHL